MELNRRDTIVHRCVHRKHEVRQKMLMDTNLRTVGKKRGIAKFTPRAVPKHLVSILILALLCFVLVASTRVEIGAQEEPGKNRLQNLVAHSVISINNTEEFQAVASEENWPGSGSEDDPYIIEGYEIDAGGGNDCIFIGNTTLHFEIRNCSVHNAWRAGITFWGLSNGTIVGCTCTFNNNGIFVCRSQNNTIADNNCSNNTQWGMEIYLWSSYNLVENNTVNGNGYGGLDGGILVWWCSDHNTVRDNICFDNLYGMAVGGNDESGRSRFNLIEGNNCSRSAYAGILFQYAPDNTLANDTFVGNLEGAVLSSASNSVVTNVTCSDNLMGGMDIHMSTYVTVVGSTFSNSHDYGGTRWSGLRIIQASVGEIRDCRFFNNAGYGLLLESGCSLFSVWNNVFGYNNGTTDVYNPTKIQAKDDGFANSWSSAGRGNYWSDWTGPDLNTDGIVDLPYNISGSTGAKDYYPLTTTPTEPIPEFGVMPLVAAFLLVVIVLTIGAKRRKTQRP